jgi:hypothetical protein
MFVKNVILLNMYTLRVKAGFAIHVELSIPKTVRFLFPESLLIAPIGMWSLLFLKCYGNILRMTVYCLSF